MPVTNDHRSSADGFYWFISTTCSGLTSLWLYPKRNPGVTPGLKLTRLASLRALLYLVPVIGVEPTTFALRMRCLYVSRYLTCEYFIVFSFIKQLVVYMFDVDDR